MFKPSTRLSWTYRRRCPKAKVAGKAVQGTMGVENASKPEMRNGASQGQKKTTLAKISNLQDMKWKQVKQYETIKVIKVKSKTYCSGPRWAQMGPDGPSGLLHLPSGRAQLFREAQRRACLQRWFSSAHGAKTVYPRLSAAQ